MSKLRILRIVSGSGSLDRTPDSIDARIGRAKKVRVFGVDRQVRDFSPCGLPSTRLKRILL